MKNPKLDVDYLVVGQGIAGTVFSYLLYKQRKSFVVVDRGIRNSSTSAAAGIVNPVTGKYFALSWLFDDLFPVALDLYEDIIQYLKIDASLNTKIVRVLKDDYQVNEWEYRAGQEKYADYMTELPPFDCLSELITPHAGLGTVKNAMQVPVVSIIEKWKDFLLKKDMYFENHFETGSLDKVEASFSWKEIRFKNLVSCEGSGLVNNKLLSNNNMLQPAKGEALLMKLPGWNCPFIFKNDVFIAPWKEKGLFWIGSTYAWNTLDPFPTLEKREEILSKFVKFYTGEFEVVDHIAGIRPATKDRRPIVGEVPDHKGWFLFNGLGTKGASLAPYFAKKLFDFIEYGYELPPEVSPARFMVE
jgi:glycine/D-amino acid oxidase-like deaminating enzyme